MATIEIVLLVIGILAFVASFFIPDVRKSEEESFAEDEVRALVEKEFEASKAKLEEMTDETIRYGMEKAERSLDKITNEKMLALGEYSDSIMNQISTNHKETVFMYDMLTKNKEELTDLLSDAKRTAETATLDAKEASERAEAAIYDASVAAQQSQKALENNILAEEKVISIRAAMTGIQEKAMKDSITLVPAAESEVEEMEEVEEELVEVELPEEEYIEENKLELVIMI